MIAFLRLLTYTFLVGILFSCSDDAENFQIGQDDAYMVALVDGEFVEFNMEITAHQNDAYSLAMIGRSEKSGSEKQSLQMVMFNSPTAISTQSYQVDGEETLVLITYSNSIIAENGEIFNQDNFSASTASTTPEDSFKVTIEEISASYVKGSFSGTVIMQNSLDSITSVSITDGEFLAPLN